MILAVASRRGFAMVSIGASVVGSSWGKLGVAMVVLMPKEKEPVNVGALLALRFTIIQRVKAMATKKVKGGGDAKASKTIRVNARIDAEALKRLRVHCAMTGLSPGEVLSRLCEGLRDWSIPVNLNAKKDRLESEGSVIDSGATLAIAG